MFRRKTSILLLVAVSLLAGCTRKEEDSSSLQISLPSKMLYQSVGSQAAPAAGDLTHFIANISGPGIPNPILFTWDACRDCSTTNPAPGSFTIKDVPSGSDRLIQILAVYQSTNGPMKFYYGEQRQEVSSGASNANVMIDPLPVNDGQATISGNIAGRYLTSANMGPTGDILVMFNPGPNKQKMLIEKSLIVAGWFRVFGLDNVGFEYKIQPSNGGAQIDMFGGGASPLNSTHFDPNDRVLKAAIPIHKKFENSTSTYIDAEAEYYVWGWFGDGAYTGPKRIYKPLSAAQPFTKLKIFNSASFLNAEGMSTIPAKSILLDTSSPFGFAKFIGGLASTGGGTVMEDYLPVLHTMIENGNDNAAGFRAPFQFMSAQSLFNISTAGNVKTLVGKVLPGVPNAIDHFRAFKISGVGMNYRVEKISCNNLSGYSLADQGVGSINPVTNGFTININMTATEASTGTAVVLCGVKDGVMYNNGAFLGPYMFQNMGPVMGGPMTQIKLAHINGEMGTIATTSNVCAPIVIRSLDASNLPASISAPFNVDLDKDGGTSLYTDPLCTNVASSPMQVHQNAQAIYAKLGPGSPFVSVAQTGNASNYSTLNFATTSATTYMGVKFFDQKDLSEVTSLYSYSCRPVYAVLVDSNGYPGTISAGTQVYANFGVNGAVNGQALETYQTGDCSGPATSNLPYSNMSPTYIYGSTKAVSLRYVPQTPAIETSVVLMASMTGSSPSMASSPAISISHPGPAASIQIQPMGLAGANYMDVPRGICLPVNLRAVDSNGRETAFGGAATLTYAAAGTASGSVTFNTSNQCSMAMPSISVAAGQSLRTVFMRVDGAFVPQTLSLTASYTNGSPIAGSWPQSGAANVVETQYLLKPITSSPTGNNVFVQTNNCVAAEVELRVGGQLYRAPSNTTQVHVAATGGAGNHGLYSDAICSGPNLCATGTCAYNLNQNGNSTAQIYYKNQTTGDDSPGLVTFSASIGSNSITASATQQISLGLQAAFSAVGSPIATDIGGGYTCLSNLRITFTDYFSNLYTGTVSSIPIPSLSSSAASAHVNTSTCAGGSLPGFTNTGYYDMAMKYGASFVYPTPGSPLTMPGILATGFLIQNTGGSIIVPAP